MEITEIARDEKLAYGISFVICTNEEVTQDLMGIEGNECIISEAANAAQDAAIKVLNDAGFDFETESSFKKYNGGPYRQIVHLRWHTAEIIEAEGFDEDEQHLITDEDTRDEWEAAWLVGAGATEIKKEIVEKAQAVQDAAINAAQKAADQMVEQLVD